MNFILFASYGNDSIALIQAAADRNLKDVHVVYSDTGWSTHWWPARVARAEQWAQSLGFTTHRIVSKGMEELARRKKAWPRAGGGKFQFCTAELKEWPAIKWMAEHDPEKLAVCMVGIRREKSVNRRQFPEFTAASERHGGRDLWAPLVNLMETERDRLIARTPFSPLSHRSRECSPCVNARRIELRLLPEEDVLKVEQLETELGVNSAGNHRVLFRPTRHGGAIGILAVIEDAKNGHDEMFSDGCDGGWCGQ